MATDTDTSPLDSKVVQDFLAGAEAREAERDARWNEPFTTPSGLTYSRRDMFLVWTLAHISPKGELAYRLLCEHTCFVAERLPIHRFKTDENDVIGRLTRSYGAWPKVKADLLREGLITITEERDSGSYARGWITAVPPRDFIERHDLN